MCNTGEVYGMKELKRNYLVLTWPASLARVIPSPWAVACRRPRLGRNLSSPKPARSPGQCPGARQELVILEPPLRGGSKTRPKKRHFETVDLALSFWSSQAWAEEKVGRVGSLLLARLGRVSLGVISSDPSLTRKV